MLHANNRLVLAAVILGGLGLATVAIAQTDRPGKHGPGHHGGRLFEKMDTNQDDTVTRAEINSYVEARLKMFDSNGDGQVTRAEFDAARDAQRAAHKKERFKQMDANGDGQISEQEFENARHGRWSKRRHDGA